MKKIIFIIIMLSVVGTFAQTPQSFKYQTVVRNNEGKALANTLISLRISILFGSPLGNAVYVETFQHATNEFGIASINIGKGTATQGVFVAINWAAGEYFIKTEVDLTGATNYDYIGTSQLLSVPYALYAEKSGKSLNDQDTSATNELQNITKIGNTITLSQGGGTITDSDNQTINLNGFNLSISDGNTIQLPPDVDHDTINEIQLITKSGNIISLSKNGGSITDSDNQSLSIVNNQLTITNGNTVNIDQDTLNEIQTISKTDSTVTLSKNGGAFTDSDNQNLTINDHQLIITNGNTIAVPDNQILTLSGTTLSISNGNSVFLQPDNDHDTLNEIQVLSKVGNTISLSKNGGSLTDGDNQNLSVVNNQLTITNGNTVNIDSDTLNEIQTISKVGNNITLSKNGGSFTDSDNQTLSLQGNQLVISNGNSVVLSGILDLDNDPTNEIQNLALSNDTLKISMGNQVVFPHDEDGDSTNEIQNLSYSNDTLNISKANHIVLPHDADRDSTNEIQNLSINGTALSISKGNSVQLFVPFNFIYPMYNNHFTPFIASSVYKPPINKIAIVTSAQSGASGLLINNQQIFSGGLNQNYSTGSSNLGLPIYLSSNDSIKGGTINTAINGILIDSTITPITNTVTASQPFTVPANKILVLTNIYLSQPYPIKINNIEIIMHTPNTNASSNQLKQPIFVDENSIISHGNPSVNCVFNGYLMDKP